jgi:uncharacterized membrane protein
MLIRLPIGIRIKSTLHVTYDPMRQGSSTNPIDRSILILVTMWCGAICLAPILVSGNGPVESAGQWIYAFFGQLCHQTRERSWLVGDHPMAVCVRCASIYFGFLVGTLLGAVRGFPSPAHGTRALVILGLAPMLIDVLSGAVGLYHGTNLSRAVTGGWFGVIVAGGIFPIACEGIAATIGQVRANAERVAAGGA